MHSATGRMSVFCCCESGRSRLRGNTESLEIDVSEAGYLAGYAAVQAGYTHLGYIGQKNEENGTKYGTGYALGAEAAAADLGLGENSITLDYTYRKSSSVSPSYLEKIKAGMVRGGQILFSDGASYQNVLGAAASAAGGALIANGGVEEYANAVLKSTSGLWNCSLQCVKEMKQKDFEGGKNCNARRDRSGNQSGMESGMRCRTLQRISTGHSVRNSPQRTFQSLTAMRFPRRINTN